MEIAETIGSILYQLQWIIRIWYCLFATLFGLFMILWGIFINGWDWILIGVGLAIFLIFGRGTYQAITGR